jgi:hypothetical protein
MAFYLRFSGELQRMTLLAARRPRISVISFPTESNPPMQIRHSEVGNQFLSMQDSSERIRNETQHAASSIRSIGIVLFHRERRQVAFFAIHGTFAPFWSLPIHRPASLPIPGNERRFLPSRMGTGRSRVPI